MTVTKVNIGLSLSRNFDKITLEMLDEPIQHEIEAEFVEGVRKRFRLLREEISQEFTKIQK